MSNLIKSAYFNVVPNENRVIDSDLQIPVMMPDLLRDSDEVENAQTDGEFHQGLNVLSMDDVLLKEREKLTQEISEEARQIVEEAKKQADELIQAAQQQAEQIRESAREEGKSLGIEEGKASAETVMEQERQRFREEMAEKREELEQDIIRLEPEFADLTIALVEKIIGIKCKEKKTVIVYLIDQALRHLERTQSLTIRVSQEDLMTVTAKKESLAAIIGAEVDFNLIEDSSFESGQCIIETDNKLLDCSLDVQLKNLQEQLTLLASY